jgi:hypothetical protein
MSTTKQRKATEDFKRKALLRRVADLPFAQALEEGARVNAATRGGKPG